METFCKNPITGFLKMEGFVDLWVDANVVMVGECTPICPVGFYSFPNCKGIIHPIIHDLIIIFNFTSIEEIWSIYNHISKYTIISFQHVNAMKWVPCLNHVTLKLEFVNALQNLVGQNVI